MPRNDDKATFLKKLVLLQYDSKGCGGVLARFEKFRVGVTLSGNDCPKFFNGVNCSPKTERLIKKWILGAGSLYLPSTAQNAHSLYHNFCDRFHCRGEEFA